jgi:hypothetical protein
MTPAQLEFTGVVFSTGTEELTGCGKSGNVSGNGNKNKEAQDTSDSLGNVRSYITGSRITTEQAKDVFDGA